MKLTNEQYRQIGKRLLESGFAGKVGDEYRIHLGTAAVAAVAPLLLAEPTPIERALFRSTEEVNRLKFPEGLQDIGLHTFVANRLASVTAKPDLAVEAVVQTLRKNQVQNCVSVEPNHAVVKAWATEIVAAVDAARAAK